MSNILSLDTGIDNKGVRQHSLAPDVFSINDIPRLFPQCQATDRGQHDHTNLFAAYEDQELVRRVKRDLVNCEIDIGVPQDLRSWNGMDRWRLGVFQSEGLNSENIDPYDVGDSPSTWPVYPP